MTKFTVFTSNRSQAVRLPKAVAFPEGVHQVDISKIGHSRVIVPQGQQWDELFHNGPRASEDFLVEREQPAAEQREPHPGGLAKRNPARRSTKTRQVMT